MRRYAWRGAVAVAAMACAGHFATAAPAGGERIALEAVKYAFSKPEIRVKRGRAVTLVITAVDFPHGFSIPDLDVRVDLVPGKAVEVTFTPQRAGRFAFLCDLFCGEGHDRMSGFLVVGAD